MGFTDKIFSFKVLTVNISGQTVNANRQLWARQHLDGRSEIPGRPERG